MKYISTVYFDPNTGLLSGTISTGMTAPVPPLGDVVISAYEDAAVLNDSHAYFAQCRTGSAGAWVLSTAALPAGQHTVSISCDYEGIAATTSITTTGPGHTPDGPRVSLLVNDSPRS